MYINYLSAVFSRYRLPALLLLLCIVTAGGAAAAATYENEVCHKYKIKLKEALDICDLDSFFALKELSAGMGSDCSEDAVNEILAEYYTICFEPHLVKAIYDCDLDLLLKEEETVNDRLKGLSQYTVMREIHRHTKCSEYSERCLQKMLDEAVAGEDWSKILSVARIIDSNTFKMCSNHFKLTALVEKAKGNYYRQWIPEKLAQTLKTQDLEEIYSLETFTFDGMKDSPDFQKMREEFLGLKCQNQDRILKDVLGEAVRNCDLNQIVQTEDLMDRRWNKNCPDYDYEAMKENFHLAKLAYLEKCFDDALVTFIGNCDLGRILDLERETKSLEDSSLHDDASDGKCEDLVKCFIDDFKDTTHSCNHKRMQLLEIMIKSNVFRKCDNIREFLKILKEEKQTFTDKCPPRKKVGIIRGGK